MLAKQAVHPSLLHALEDGSLYVRPRAAAAASAEHGAPPLLWYEALGRLLGCAIAQACLGESGVSCPLPLASALCKHATDEPLRAADVRASCPMLYRLRVDALLEPGGIENVAAALCEDALYFASDDDPPVELCDGGASVRVCDANVHDYVCRLSEHLLCGEVRHELHALLRGLWSVVPLAALLEARIDALDLGMLLSGTPSFDLDQWAAATKVEAASDVGATAVEERRAAFFRVLASFDDELRGRCFAFVTGLHRLPANGGFTRLHPPFTLQLLGEAFAGRLPVAHTCFNALQLAPPKSRAAEDGDAELARALTTAVTLGGEGFGLV